MIEALILVVGSFAFLFGLAFLNTFVFSCLWGWFLTPVFNIAVPSFALLYGLMLVAGFILPTAKTEGKPMSELVASAFAKAGVFLLFGWIVHQFV